MNSLSLTFLMLVLVLVGSSHAYDLKVTRQIKQGAFSLGVGSHVEIVGEGFNNTASGVFLGRIIDPSFRKAGYLVLDEASTKITVYGSNEIKLPKGVVPKNVVRPYEQVNNNCAGYAFYHYFTQLLLNGVKGEENKLKKALSTEQGRTQMLVSAIDDYYISGSSGLIKSMNRLGVNYGITCKEHKFTKFENFKNYIEGRVVLGLPTLIGFDIGPNMISSSYEVIKYGKSTKEDPRLWLPRKIGQRNAGGHAIIIDSQFYSRGRSRVLVIDSDWDLPRVWDLNKYLLNPKVDFKSLELVDCGNAG